jgi:hypothetical protein
MPTVVGILFQASGWIMIPTCPDFFYRDALMRNQPATLSAFEAERLLISASRCFLAGPAGLSAAAVAQALTGGILVTPATCFAASGVTGLPRQ